jgi:hypothetical protein
LFLHQLQQAFDSGKLQFFGAIEKLRDAGEFRSYIAPLKQTEWCVYAKAPFAGPQQVLNYVGRYTHRVAISNDRLIDMENGQVRFHWKDYRHHDRHKIMILPAEEFIRRFLIHVLPQGFQRIRYYGFRANRHRDQSLKLCRQLLPMHPATPQPTPGDPPSDDDWAAYNRSSPLQCPVCRQGRMIIVETLAPVRPFTDTS